MVAVVLSARSYQRDAPEFLARMVKMLCIVSDGEWVAVTTMQGSVMHFFSRLSCCGDPGDPRLVNLAVPVYVGTIGEVGQSLLTMGC